MAAGADFLVSPGFVKEVADYAVSQRYFLCTRLYDTYQKLLLLKMPGSNLSNFSREICWALIF